MTNKTAFEPVQCHLWAKEKLEDYDLYGVFEDVQVFFEDSHFSRKLMRCKQCGQLYLKEFKEDVDWIDGEDPQYWTYVPVRDMAEADGMDIALSPSPRIHVDYPKGEPKKIYWARRGK